MRVTVETIEGGRASGTLSGEVDADNSADMGAELLRQTNEARDVVLDISELSFIDSSGISELLRIRDSLAAEDGSFVLTSPTASVRRVFEITGLIETFGL